MNAYKCDICGKFFEDTKALTGSAYPVYAEAIGHHKMKINLDDHSDDGRDWDLFVGDICPDCMGYFCVGLCERGCNNDNVKMYAADYIKRVREKRGLEKEEVKTDGPTE